MTFPTFLDLRENAMNKILNRNFVILIMTTLVIACGGDKTFNDWARAGDTVAVAGGYQPNFNLGNISVDIILEPGSNLITSYPRGNRAIRASVNLYPDPLSGFIVSRETGIEMTPFANTYFPIITSAFTNNDIDWFQTTVFVDLPSSLSEGTYTVRVRNTLGEEQFESAVVIVAGTGSPSTSTAANGVNLNGDMFAGISRLPHHTIDFTGSAAPQAIELTLSHDADSTAGGTGKAFAVNPIGYKKNLAWSDDGTTMKVILTPSTSTTPINLIDYKFYVTGAINNLVVSSVLAFDTNGDSVTGVTATSTASN